MGRHKIDEVTKKVTISITLDEAVYNDLDLLGIKSKSQLIDWLLKEHFNLLKNGDNKS